jgi:hypothetical protein
LIRRADTLLLLNAGKSNDATPCAKSNCYPMAARRVIRCAKSGVTRWLMCFWLTVLCS